MEERRIVSVRKVVDSTSDGPAELVRGPDRGLGGMVINADHSEGALQAISIEQASGSVEFTFSELRHINCRLWRYRRKCRFPHTKTGLSTFKGEAIPPNIK